IYKLKAPDENACRSPEQWQTYDIVFRAPRYDEKGTKLANARLTVTQNGKSIQKNVEVPDKTGGGDAEAPGPAPLRLQDHHNKVRFRNIWLVPLTATVRKEKPDDDSAQPWNKMDYGSMLSATFEDQQGAGQFSNKGLAIKVGDENAPAGIIFDTGLLRWSTAWTGGYLHY